jgi:hypothetical protein
VAAALPALLAVVAGGCEVPPSASTSPGEPTPSAPASSAPLDSGPAGRLLVVVGGPDRPHGTVHDPAGPAAAGLAFTLPRGVAPLVAIATSPDGSPTAVSADGRAWVATPAEAVPAAGPTWQRLAIDLTGPALPGPVLGATWSRDGAALLLLAGAPGSGIRRTAVITVPPGGPAAAVEVPLEADGPAIAAVTGGQVAFVVRDHRDREALARVAPAGSFVTMPLTGRAVAVGGGLVAIVGDATVVVGGMDELDRGVLPSTPLPLVGGAGVGAVAIAPDGLAVAVVRLDAAGEPARVEVLRRAGDGWATTWSRALEPGARSALVAWVR